MSAPSHRSCSNPPRTGGSRSRRRAPADISRAGGSGRGATFGSASSALRAEACARGGHRKSLSPSGGLCATCVGETWAETALQVVAADGEYPRRNSSTLCLDRQLKPPLSLQSGGRIGRSESLRACRSRGLSPGLRLLRACSSSRGGRRLGAASRARACRIPRRRVTARGNGYSVATTLVGNRDDQTPDLSSRPPRGRDRSRSRRMDRPATEPRCRGAERQSAGRRHSGGAVSARGTSSPAVCAASEGR